MRPHRCRRLSVFLLLLLFVVWYGVPEARVSRSSDFHGGGEVYSWERSKEGCGFQRPGAAWSAV